MPATVLRTFRSISLRPESVTLLATQAFVYNAAEQRSPEEIAEPLSGGVASGRRIRATYAAADSGT